MGRWEGEQREWVCERGGGERWERRERRALGAPTGNRGPPRVSLEGSFGGGGTLGESADLK